MKICICPIGGIKHDLAPTRALKISKSAVFPRHRRRGQLTSDSLERYQIQMGELKFIGKRVVYLAVMLFGVATLVFILTKMIPGDPVVANLSQRALNDPEIVAAYVQNTVWTARSSCSISITSVIFCTLTWGPLSVPAVRYWTIWQDAIPLLWNWPCFPS